MFFSLRNMKCIFACRSGCLLSYLPHQKVGWKLIQFGKKTNIKMKNKNNDIFKKYRNKKFTKLPITKSIR